MDLLVEILKEILPAIITGICTFFITRYSYNKNVPLDKMEIAYNRIYYPIYKIIYGKYKDNINDLDTTIRKIKPYLDKYNKYADISTIKLFDLLCKNKDKNSYINFVNNICNKNTYLRRKLGYLEPNVIQIYTYANKTEKFMIRLLLEIIILYCSVIVYTFKNGIIKEVSLTIAVIDVIFVIFEYILYIFYIVKIKIKDCYNFFRSKKS